MKPIIQDNTNRAILMIAGITDRELGDLASDSAKLAQQMARDRYANSRESTGALAASMHSERVRLLSHVVVSDPKGGYGAYQEWGFHTRSKKRVKGTHIILRAVAGMIKRHSKGGRWEER